MKILIESRDKSAINSLIEQKLKDASENAEFYRSIINSEFADNEQLRANQLMRDLNKLRAVI